MKTIEERAKEYAKTEYEQFGTFPEIVARESYTKGATEQKTIDIDKACNAFCHTGCPHKTDSYNCLKDKCDTWKTFRRMMEE